MSAIALCLYVLLLTQVSDAANGTVNAKTIAGKVLYGYQAWFRCPGDGSGWTDFWHWTHYSKKADSSTVNVDLWPDVSEYPSQCQCDTGFTFSNGQPAKLYSSYCDGVIDTHFKWMREYGIDGVLVQRFFGYQNQADTAQILEKIRTAAEKYGRVFAVEYDMSGASGDQIHDFLVNDWNYLTNTLKITTSKSYLHHNNKPVLEIWGFFKERMTPSQAIDVLNYFKKITFLIAGVNWIWRSNDVINNDPYKSVYSVPDVIQPWMVGAFDQGGFQSSWNKQVQDDMDYAKSINVEYSPVIFPGFSWYNMHLNNNPPEVAKFNQIPRNGGDFITAQYNLHISKKPLFLFLAMFDECDEGTAQYKVAATAAAAPAQSKFVTLDIDGKKLSTDTYLKLAGKFTAQFKAAVNATL